MPICRRASNSTACMMKRIEFMFLISQRVPSVSDPFGRTLTFTSARRFPSCMLPSLVPR